LSVLDLDLDLNLDLDVDVDMDEARTNGTLLKSTFAELKSNRIVQVHVHVQV